MRRQLSFCKSWFAAKRKPTEIWSESRAKEAHSTRRPYTVLIDSLERPYCSVTVTDKFVGVDFFDAHLRETLTYRFQEVVPGKLFLTMATHREYDGSTDKVANGTTYMFDQDGSVQTRREIFIPDHHLEVATSKTNVTAKYSTYPEFGEYDDLIRVERS